MPTRRREKRRHPRYKCNGIVLQAGWQGPDGSAKMGLVRALNISEGGICLELPDDALPSSMIRLHAQKHLHLRGLGSIRHSHRMGHKVRVGVEFIDGLRWDPPDEPNEAFAGGVLQSGSSYPSSPAG
jgi:PilZ domain-containing protein